MSIRSELDNAFPYDGSVSGWGRRLAEEGHAVDSIVQAALQRRRIGGRFSQTDRPLNVVDGVGDLMGAVRDDMPIRKGSRESVLEAGHGTSSYLAYDEQIADETIRWLQEAALRPSEKPWLLFVGFVCPHPPFTARPDLFEHFMSQELPAPVQGREDEWPRHPVLDQFRAAFRYDAPFTEEQIQRAAAAYYGTCARLDAQIGRVLNALEEMNLNETTRVIYTSDHGESLGSRGLFGKFTMYEESAGVPLIMAGPDVPEGETSGEIVSLVDMYPTFLEALGVQPNEAEADLPASRCGQSQMAARLKAMQSANTMRFRRCADATWFGRGRISIFGMSAILRCCFIWRRTRARRSTLRVRRGIRRRNGHARRGFCRY